MSQGGKSSPGAAPTRAIARAPHGSTASSGLCPQSSSHQLHLLRSLAHRGGPDGEKTSASTSSRLFHEPATPARHRTARQVTCGPLVCAVVLPPRVWYYTVRTEDPPFPPGNLSFPMQRNGWWETQIQIQREMRSHRTVSEPAQPSPAPSPVCWPPSRGRRGSIMGARMVGTVKCICDMTCREMTRSKNPEAASNISANTVPAERLFVAPCFLSFSFPHRRASGPPRSPGRRAVSSSDTGYLMGEYLYTVRMDYYKYTLARRPETVLPVGKCSVTCLGTREPPIYNPFLRTNSSSP